MNVTQKIVLALLAGVMVLIVGILSFTTVRQLVRSARGMDRSIETIVRIESVLSTLKDAETGQRGYLITGDERYLDPYRPARDSVRAQLSAIRGLSRDNALRLARLDTLATLAERKLRELDETIVLYDRAGPRAALSVVRTDSGRTVMNAARRLVADMELGERETLRQQEATRRVAGERAQWIIGLGTALAVILIVTINRSIRTDVQRQQQLREEAERARAMAQAASTAKSDFLATMSHEIRTPINAILGYTELLGLGLTGPLTDEQRQQLARVSASTRHLLGLVNDVLDLAKVEAGTLRVEQSHGVCCDAVDAALALIRPQAAAKGIVISERCEGTRDALYLGDEPRVRQVLGNLLVNAVKFTKPGGRVTIGCTVNGGPPRSAGLAERSYVSISVRDTGIGIPEDKLAAIFQPFVQAEVSVGKSYTREQEGAGLGLAISRQLARRMEGEITVSSAVGAGSTFTLWLPAANPAPAGTG